MEKNMSGGAGSGSAGIKIIFGLALLGLLAAGCAKVTLQQNVPTVPKESYEQLPQ